MNSKFKSFKFWLAFSSALLILIQSVLKPFGLQLNEDIYTSIINALLGVFVVLGIVSPPNSTNETKDENENNKNINN